MPTKGSSVTHYLHHYASPVGGITLAGNGEALIGLWFEGQKYFGSTLREHYIEKNLPVFEQADDWLAIYFSGREPAFTPPLAIGAIETTPFRKSVWEILLTIPFGQTMTYGEVAEQIAKQQKIASMSAQAVGGAIAHNPISLMIPCHRVIGAKGKLIGYAGGITRKEKLLSMEQNGNGGDYESSCNPCDRSVRHH